MRICKNMCEFNLKNYYYFNDSLHFFKSYKIKSEAGRTFNNTDSPGSFLIFQLSLALFLIKQFFTKSSVLILTNETEERFFISLTYETEERFLISLILVCFWIPKTCLCIFFLVDIHVELCKSIAAKVRFWEYLQHVMKL